MQQKLQEILSQAKGWMTAAEMAEKGGWRSGANVAVALQQMEKSDGRVERRKSATKKQSNGLPATEWKLTEKMVLDLPPLDVSSAKISRHHVAAVAKKVDAEIMAIPAGSVIAVRNEPPITGGGLEAYNLRQSLALAESQRDEHFARAEDNERAYNAWMAFAKEYECKSIPELRVFIDSCMKRIDTLAGKSIDATTQTEPAGYLVTAPHKAPRKFIKERTAKAAAASAAKAAGIAEIFAIHPHMKAVRGVEFKVAA